MVNSVFPPQYGGNRLKICAYESKASNSLLLELDDLLALDIHLAYVATAIGWFFDVMRVQIMNSLSINATPHKNGDKT